MNGSSPLISVVLPTYNGLRYLQQSVDSVLGQTLGSLELIVVDDASTDETPALISRIAVADPRLRVVTHPRNEGLPTALNTGFRMARGDYLTWTSDDNLYRPEALAEMLAALDDHPEVGVVYADYTEIDGDGEVIRTVRVHEPEAIARYNVINACFLFRREVYSTIGEYDPGFALVEDYEYWLRVAQQFSIMPLHRNLYLKRFHEGSLTSRYGPGVAKAYERALVEHLPRMQRVPARARAAAYRHLADLAMNDGRYATSAGYALSAVRLAPQPSLLWGARKIGRLGRRHTGRGGRGAIPSPPDQAGQATAVAADRRDQPSVRSQDAGESVPRVSVVLPVFNGEAFVLEAIDSILGQTMRDFELIVIDDGSKDHTWELINARARTDSRVRPVLNEQNRGIVESLNRGLSLARAEYIARMDADDVSLPTRLERQLAWMLPRPSVGLCGARVRPVALGGGQIHKIYPLTTSEAEVKCGLLFSCQFVHPSVLIRRSAFPQGELRYDPAFLYAEDYELWARASSFTELINVPEVLLDLRIHPGGLSLVHQAEQARKTRAVQAMLARRLGLDPGDEQMAVHESLGRGVIPVSRVFVNQAETWLLALLRANRSAEVYPEEEFSRLLAAHWYRVCRHSVGLGPWAYRRWRASPLKTEIGRGAAAGFMASALVGGRRRAG